MTTIIKYCTVVVRVKNFIIYFITTSINIGRITTNMMKEIGHLLLYIYDVSYYVIKIYIHHLYLYLQHPPKLLTHARVNEHLPELLE